RKQGRKSSLALPLNPINTKWFTPDFETIWTTSFPAKPIKCARSLSSGGSSVPGFTLLIRFDYSPDTYYSFTQISKPMTIGQWERIMSIRRCLAAAAAVITAGFALLYGPVFAHHSSVPFYDPENRVEFEGTVTRWVFRNPHAFLFIAVTEASGATEEWQIELGAPVSIRRAGWSPDTLEVGQQVKVSGQRSRAEGTRGICCVRMTKPDGSPITEGGRVEESPARR
ncbi:MAG: DUF6152 family protein, partial [Gammaproteobacteria bacterium]|nr:DUF6152 family protein [Gammaproteobacteria bacterium]